jgi:hypothetical protein
MKLLVDVALHAHALDPLDVAGARPEGEAVQHVHGLLVRRQRRRMQQRPGKGCRGEES